MDAKPRGRLTGTGAAPAKDRGPAPVLDPFEIVISLPPVEHHPVEGPQGPSTGWFRGWRSRVCSCGHIEIALYGWSFPATTHWCPGTDPRRLVHWKKS